MVSNKPAAAALALLFIAAAQVAIAAPSTLSIPKANDIRSSALTTQYPYEIKLDFFNGKFRLTYSPQSDIYQYYYVYLYSGLAKDFPAIPNIANVHIDRPFTEGPITYMFSAPCNRTTPVDYASYALLFRRSDIPDMSTVVTTTIVCGYDYSSACDVNACLNGGDCDRTTKQCKCPLGYSGNKCEVKIKSAANDLCKGYLNTSCSDQGNGNVCLNGGRYQPVSGNEYVCLCPENFVGKNCETAFVATGGPCSGNPCANEGTCQAFDASTYTCECPSGYAGARCETQIAVPSCVGNPCVHGMCMSGIDGSSHFYCQCPPAYIGDSCESPVFLGERMCDALNNPCFHDGTCIIAKSDDGVIHRSYCECKDNWVGPYCEFQGRQRTITLENRCTEKIWPAILGNPLPMKGGFELNVNATQSFQVPSNWISARIWARTKCADQTSAGGSTKLVCETGDCSRGLECMGAGSNNVSLAEFTLGTSDTYYVSLGDGFNVQLAIIPSHLPALARTQSDDIYNQCRQTYCANDLTGDCPAESQVVVNNRVVGCKSSCNTYQIDESRCKGDYSEMAKMRCPLSYTNANDGNTSTFTCPDFAEPNYTVIFCP